MKAKNKIKNQQSKKQSIHCSSVSVKFFLVFEIIKANSKFLAENSVTSISVCACTSEKTE